MAFSRVHKVSVILILPTLILQALLLLTKSMFPNVDNMFIRPLLLDLLTYPFFKCPEAYLCKMLAINVW